MIEPRGTAPEFAELLDWLADNGVPPRRLWPESVRVIDGMPETPAGKIRKNILREMITEEIA